MADDPIKDTHKAMNLGVKRAVEMDHQLATRIVTAPAFPEDDDPRGFMAEKPRKKEDRKRDYLTVRHNAGLISQMAMEQAARKKLPKHKPISRAVVKFFQEGEREFGDA